MHFFSLQLYVPWCGHRQQLKTTLHLINFYVNYFPPPPPVLCPVVRALPKTQAHVAEASDRLQGRGQGVSRTFFFSKDLIVVGLAADALDRL